MRYSGVWLVIIMALSSVSDADAIVVTTADFDAEGGFYSALNAAAENEGL